MKLKTRTLLGAQLDYAVALAAGFPVNDNCDNKRGIQRGRPQVPLGTGGCELFQPSTNWAHGGPIIERGRVHLTPGQPSEEWRAHTYDGEAWGTSYGPTPLIAALRGYVASKLGDEVEVAA